MAEAGNAAAELVKPIMALFLTRKERRAVEEAATLRFWKDGTYKQLKLFADGKGTPQALAEIRAGLRDSEEQVMAALSKLKELRNQMGGGAIAKAVDEILNDDDYGKSSIREGISWFLVSNLSEEEKKNAARSICLRIESLNAALERLYRLVYE